MKKMILLISFLLSIYVYAGEFEDDKKLCNDGNITGCYDLGVDYAQGIGTTIDNAKALEYYHIACDSNYMAGCYNIGSVYLQGIGVKKDINKSKKYLSKACKGDFGLGYHIITYW